MILDIMKSRRSIREFKPDKPERKTIEALVEAAITAPSASNKQPWRFFIVDNSATIKRLAEAVRSALENIAGHVEAEFRKDILGYGRNFSRFENAPVIIVPAFTQVAVLSNLLDLSADDETRGRVREMEYCSGAASVSMAMQNLVLYAHSEGLGTCCMTGPLLAENEIRRMLDIPEQWHIAAIIAVGFPGENPAAPPRKSASAVTRWVLPANR
jgi:nitroreductase